MLETLLELWIDFQKNWPIYEKGASILEIAEFNSRLVGMEDNIEESLKTYQRGSVLRKLVLAMFRCKEQPYPQQKIEEIREEIAASRAAMIVVPESTPWILMEIFHPYHDDGIGYRVTNILLSNGGILRTAKPEEIFRVENSEGIAYWYFEVKNDSLSWKKALVVDSILYCNGKAYLLDEKLFTIKKLLAMKKYEPCQ